VHGGGRSALYRGPGQEKAEVKAATGRRRQERRGARGGAGAGGDSGRRTAGPAARREGGGGDVKGQGSRTGQDWTGPGSERRERVGGQGLEGRYLSRRAEPSTVDAPGARGGSEQRAGGRAEEVPAAAHTGSASSQQQQTSSSSKSEQATGGERRATMQPFAWSNGHSTPAP
jgi:hypothetical protein